MSIISKEIAKQHLEMWLKAEEAVSTGQSYQIEQMQPKIKDANRAFWKNKDAEAEFRGAVTNFLITNLDASGHVFEGIDQS